MQQQTRQPTHPGTILKEDYPLPLSLTLTELSGRLNVSRKTLSKIVNRKGSVTPEMALRLARVFDTTPQFWMNLQGKYDLWQAEYGSEAWQVVERLPARILHSDVVGA